MSTAACQREGQMLGSAEVAQAMGITTNALYVRRHRGNAVPPLEVVGGRLAISAEALRAWLDEQARG